MVGLTGASTSPPRAESRPRAMNHWRDRTLADMLGANGLADTREHPLPTDGWSGASFTRIEHDARAFVVKRTSAARDWIVRATRDTTIREGWLAGAMGADRPWLGTAAGGLASAYLGAAADPAGPAGTAAILMPDLTDALAAWQRRAGTPVLTGRACDDLIVAMASLHALPWSEILTTEAAHVGDPAPPWCPLPERLTLLTPRSASSYETAGERVAEIFLRGWAGFERRASTAARDLVARLADDPAPLVAALERLPSVGLHGDLKLANAAYLDDGRVAFIDWQMTLRAPVAVELGWFLVTNSAELPQPPTVLLAGYHEAIGVAAGRWRFAGRHPGRDDLIGDWATQTDLAMIVGLLLRGWRKGMDAEAGIALGSGTSAVDDLAWWCDHAVAAADRRL